MQDTGRAWVSRRGCSLVVATVFLAVAPGWSGASAADPAAAGVLDLPGEGQLPGLLVPVDGDPQGPRRSLLWKSPLFVVPFEFPLDQVHGLRFAAAERAARPAGSWRVHLRGGDLLVGDLESVDASMIGLAVGGRRPAVRIARDVVDRLVRSGAATMDGFLGPGELADWRQTPVGSWRQEAGGLVAEGRMASIVRDVRAAARARYDVVLSWKGRPPEFRLAVGADEKSPETDAYRLEMLVIAGAEPGLAVVRREAATAEIEPLDVPTTGQTLRMSLFVDQAKGRLVAAVPRGDRVEPIGELVLAPADGREPSGLVRLTCLAGSVRLESLTVAAWTADTAAIDRAVGTTLRGRDLRLEDIAIESLEGDAVVVQHGGSNRRLPLADIDEIVFQPPAAEPGATAVQPGTAKPAVRIVSAAGQSLSGELVRIDGSSIWVQRAGIDAPVGMALAEMIAVRSLQTAEPPELPGRAGRLEAEGVSVDGCIAPTAEGVVWRPRAAVNGSAFQMTTEGAAPDVTVMYTPRGRGQPDPEQPLGGIGGQVMPNDDGFYVVAMMTEDGAAAKDGRLGAGDRIMAIAPEKGSPFVETKGLDQDTVMNLLRGRIGTPVRLRIESDERDEPQVIELVRGPINVMNTEMLAVALDVHARLAPQVDMPVDRLLSFPAKLFLRTGDVLPCAVRGISAAGLELSTPAATGTAAVTVPTPLVQAVELLPSAGRGIDRARAERLLTLPRMRRADPPRHLLRLENGDYIRGTVVGLDADTLTIDLQGAVKPLPRATVSRVIWLHPDEPDGVADGAQPAVAAAEAPRAANQFLVQGIAGDGRRLTVVPRATQDGVILGTSAAIGDCRIELGTIDRLLFGAAIERESATLPYRQWKLRAAPEPRAVKGQQAAVDNTRS